MSAAQDVVFRAYQLRGTKYVLGSESPTATDCSGLVFQCFRDTGNGALVGTSRKLAAGYARYFANLGRYVKNIDAAEPGDLVCFTHGSNHISHIGIYVGNHKIISALTTTGVTETHYNTISVTFDGVCLVNWGDSRAGNDDPGDDGDEDPADPTDPDYNNQPTTPDTQEGIGNTPNMTGEWMLPIRKMEIRFPTPTDALYKLTLGYTFDQGFLGIDPYPTPDDPGPEPPIDYPTFTEDFPLPVSTPGFGTFGGGDGDWPINTGLHYFIRRGEYGQESGGGGGVYSSVGIEHGFAANIDWPHSICGFPGPGAWNKWEDSEYWVDLQIDDFDREQIRANAQDYLLTWNANTLVQGYVPALNVRIAHVDPAAGLYGAGDTIGTLTNPNPNFDDAQVISTRTCTLGSVVVPWSSLVTGDKCYLVVSPAWECERGAYFCDPFYTGGPLACIAQGPRCSGQGKSGVFSLSGGGPSSITSIVRKTITASGAWIGGDPLTGGSLYRTQYPYLAGTLQIEYEGQTLRQGADFIETNPPAGEFQLRGDLRDQSEYITVTYKRADITTTGVPPGTGTDFPPGSGPYIPPPYNPYGTTYRPANQRQFGWGTIYDSTNCNMACAAMALDRHSLGQYTATQTQFPAPYNTPPQQRTQSGNTGLNGTGHDDTTRAWNNGWSQAWTYPGPSSFESMVNNIASGRGCTVFGRYGYMDARYKKSRTYDGPHAIYLNEQLPDGSFWGYDPIVGYAINWPYDVIKTYAESYYGFSGRVTAGFTKVTPKV